MCLHCVCGCINSAFPASFTFLVMHVFELLGNYEHSSILHQPEDKMMLMELKMLFILHFDLVEMLM